MEVTPCDDVGPYASGSGVGRINRNPVSQSRAGPRGYC